MLQILGKVAGVFIIVFIGFGANKIGWLPVDASKYLSKIVINIAAPCVVLHSMAEQELNAETFNKMVLILSIVLVIYLVSWALSVPIAKLLKVGVNDFGVYQNFLIFTNNAFMGYPIAYALFGSEGMFFLVLANMWMPIFLYTVGVSVLQRGQHEHLSRGQLVKKRLKDMVNAPIISALIGLAIFLIQIPIPEGVSEVLESVGAMMAPLSMMVIGLQLTESSPKEVMLNHKLIIVSALRLIVFPALVYLVLLPFAIEPLVMCIMVLNIMLPCAAVPVSLAEEYGGNVKIAAEGTFLSTLFSMVTLPVGGVLLTMFVL